MREPTKLGRARLRALVMVGGSLAISAVMLWLAVRGVDLDDVKGVLGKAQIGWVLLGTLMLLVIYPVNALRWRRLARKLDPPGPVRMTELVLVGAAATNALPGRLGEPVRALGLARLTRRPFLEGFGTVIADRIADLAIACVCLVATFGAVDHPRWVTWFALLGLATAVIGVGLLIIAARRPESGAGGEQASPLRRHVTVLVAGLRGLRGAHTVALVVSLTVGGWFIWALGAWLLAHSLHIDLSVTAVTFTFAVLALGSAIPSAPGFVGTYHWIAANALQLFGVSSAQSVAYAVLLHAAWFIPTTTAGIGAMLRLGLGLSAVRQARAVAVQVDGA